MENGSHSNVIQALNTQVTNWSVLSVKLHNYHWYVKGPPFFTLHDKFEQLYAEANTYIDELAERILALKDTPGNLVITFVFFERSVADRG